MYGKQMYSMYQIIYVEIDSHVVAFITFDTHLCANKDEHSVSSRLILLLPDEYIYVEM